MSRTDRPYVMLCIGGMRRNPVRVRGCRATVTGKSFLVDGHGVSRKAEDGRRSGSQETPAADDRPPTGAQTRGKDDRRVNSYPFSAVAGLEDLRLALLINAVSPAVGGVLVRGEKGTAKSTIVRALAALLPAVDVVAGCRFSCDPGGARPRVPGRPARRGRPRRGGTPGAARRAARRRVRGPARRLARPRAGAHRRRPRVRAGPARRRAPRRALRRRGQPAPRPPGRPAARRRRHGPRPTSSARASRSGTPRGSCWSAP